MLGLSRLADAASDAAPEAAAISAVDPIARRPLHAAAIDRLREAIVRGELAPGTRLNERVLATQLGISRTPLREAFKLLRRESLTAPAFERVAQIGLFMERGRETRRQRKRTAIVHKLVAKLKVFACKRLIVNIHTVRQQPNFISMPLAYNVAVSAIAVMYFAFKLVQYFVVVKVMCVSVSKHNCAPVLCLSKCIV